MELSEVKKNLNREVLYGNNRYLLTGVILRLDKKTRKFYYTAELFDLYSKRSLLYCALEKIQKLGG
uniref:Uncharacterized protein n=1 Tax=Siphoviridae sp. cto6l14 TaxID=2827590 RepID=A0A8S5LPD2_9CAUD|nr:MAG TPA: hypothetical protein [Siphoviridae sp. cto6l14]